MIAVYSFAATMVVLAVLIVVQTELDRRDIQAERDIAQKQDTAFALRKHRAEMQFAAARYQRAMDATRLPSLRVVPAPALCLDGTCPACVAREAKR